VIEKITGQRFEDYVEHNWFQPLGMTTASYFDTPEVESRLTKLYREDGTTVPYWHILMRPAGSINASAREMANYVQFFLNRGSFGGIQLLPPEAIDRMEQPTSNYAAREGLKTGYGLSNYTTVYRRIFHGHNGGVDGGLTELAYLPGDGVGYVCMINSGNGGALNQINGLIRMYLNQTLPKPAVPPVALVAASIVRDYVPVSDRLFRRPNDGAPTVALIANKSEGTLFVVSTETFRRIPGWEPWVDLAVIAMAFLLMASSLLFALVWAPAKLFGHLRGVAYLSVRAMPALATLSVGCTALLLALSSDDALNRLGAVTVYSAGIFLSTLAFGVFSVLGLVLALRFRGQRIRRLVWWHAFAASLVLTVVAIYLGYWGLIGWRPWA